MARALVPVTWRLEPALFEKVQAAARQRGRSVQAYASEALRRAVESERHLEPPTPHEGPDAQWVGQDLSGMADMEPFDWGPDGPPDGDPVAFEPGVGFVTVGERP